MTDRPAVYTAIYGGVDELIAPVAQDIEVDWYCFTDDPSRPGTQPWQVVVQPGRYDDSRLNAKWPKLMPHEALPRHRWTIWVDGNLAIDSPSFVREALSYAGSGLAVFRHPLRYSICHEAYACLRRPDCRMMPLLEQVRHYYSQGYEDVAGLYACNVLVRDSVRWSRWGIGESWLEECMRWSLRDQLSFPVLLSEAGLAPDLFPFHIGRAPWWLTLARFFGLTPGSFPTYLLTEEARALCSIRWFPPLQTFPVEWTSSGALPRPVWMSNPWFDVRPHLN